MTQHLSDEAVAAYADGVLNGHARERAAKHIGGCAECRTAVRVQREAAVALRAAGMPPAPSTLVERLRSVPMTTPMPAPPPTAIAPDGTTMLSTFGPVAAFVPARQRRSTRVPPMLTAAAIVALAGALGGASAAAAFGDDTGTSDNRVGNGQVVRHLTPATGGDPVVVDDPVRMFRAHP